METAVSLLERLAGAPSEDDWRRLNDLYRPLRPSMPGTKLFPKELQGVA